MEWEKNKRAREDDEIEIESSAESNDSVKKRNVYGISFTKEKKEMEEEDYFGAWDSHLAMGVFDFPWLKDGVMSKLDQCLDFEDSFSSSLEHQDTLFKHSVDFSEEYGLCITPDLPMVHIEEAKLIDDMWQPFESNWLELEAEDGDYIWSSLLNKPL
ncbi:hypothetical protein PHAVU_006G135200 [Phaseolus vulgaris]|uniref:Uncharacterized protein n=1 Tax=Phaseolus vulgaris TaxID=3885 RepID=V7BNI9_PHAVU|nr:hypothetical protein PHAVU_006G135200g [Phaseolus vulgaris]ESW19559.1 hypothetical protein PHAVU_006G135200g [Phaseolus vulgaris]